MPEHQQTQQSQKTESFSQRSMIPANPIHISHPASIIQRAKINPKSLTHADVIQLQRTIGNRAVVRLLSEIGLIPSKAKQAPPVQRQELVQRQEIPEEEEPLQGKFESGPEKEICHSCMQIQEIPEKKEPLKGKIVETIQRQEVPEEEEPLQTKRENNTGMPDNLKAGVESLSGIDMSDVRVHYNSSKPADVGAFAYTQGTNIHVAPGQERHLPHEAWHVVQQAQGRVKPTFQMKDVAVNDDEGLEQEADVMGAKAFTSGQGEYFRQGKYEPRSREGQELIVQRITDVTNTDVTRTAATYIKMDHWGYKELKKEGDYIKTDGVTSCVVLAVYRETADKVEAIVAHFGSLKSLADPEEDVRVGLTQIKEKMKGSGWKGVVFTGVGKAGNKISEKRIEIISDSMKGVAELETVYQKTGVRIKYGKGGKAERELEESSGIPWALAAKPEKKSETVRKFGESPV